MTKEKYAGLVHQDLNALINMYDTDGNMQLDADREAARRYMIDVVNANYRFFHDLEEKVDYLICEGYWDEDVVLTYGFDNLKALMKHAYAKRFRFETYMGALKFFASYALKSNDGKNWLERYEDRIVLTAIFLSDGDLQLAYDLIDDMISGAFQPATPTFLNAGKKQRGEFSSCYLIRTEDNMESIARNITSALQLSKRGGGVGINLTNLREQGAAIKGIEGAASGLIPVMKIFEDSFSYANQLGARQGAGVVYVHACHPDILSVLDTKRENADEKIRIKTLSLGIVVPDIMFELAKQGKDMYTFSPADVQKVYGVPFSDISVTKKYDEMVANKRIKKGKVNTRELFQTIGGLTMESGYPYLMFEDNANRQHNLSGRITQSNLCVEIIQQQTPSTFNEDGTYAEVGEDIVCNLGSINAARAVDDGPNFGAMIEHSIRALTTVSDAVNLESVPSIKNGNQRRHAIGLGAMNLHGLLASNEIHYDSDEGRDVANAFFNAQAYYAYRASNRLAADRRETFYEFEESKYADGTAFDKFIDSDWTEVKTDRAKQLLAEKGFYVPTRGDWQELADDIINNGLYNSYLLAVAPTGSISYVNHSTSSIHPIVAPIEARKEGKLGRVYNPAYGMRDDNMEYYRDAYEIGYEPLIEMYSIVQRWVDQGISATLFFKGTATTRDINKAHILAWRKGLKTTYYIRVKSDALEGTEAGGCVSCAV